MPPTTTTNNTACRRKLTSIADVRTELVYVYNQLKFEKIDCNKAGKLTYILNILAGVIRDTELEKRIDELELTIMKRNKD